MKKFFPWIITILAAFYLLSALKPASPSRGFDITAFGRLPVLLNGRVQPLDSVARNALMQIRTRQSVALPDRSKLSASEWLLEVMTQPEKADDRKVFRIDNGEVVSLLKLTPDALYYSYKEIGPQIDEIEKQAQSANEVESAHRTAYQRHILRLYSAVALYNRLKNSLLSEGTQNFTAHVQSYQKIVPDGVAAFKARENKAEFDQKKLDEFIAFARTFERQSHSAYILLIPPTGAARAQTDWANPATSLLGAMHSQSVNPAVLAYCKIADAWRSEKSADFNQAVTEYGVWLQQNNFSKEAGKGRSEYFFHQIQSFYRAMAIYVMAFILGVIGIALLEASPGWSEALRRSAYYLIVLALIVHTFGLIYRMVLEGRPPVTNLYSSAIFIGWGSVILGLFVEYFFRVGIGNMVSSLIGFTTLVIAHNLSLGGDTMQMLNAVLDTNFWLATHVVTITLGYSATFMAGMIALAYIVLGIFTPILSRTVGNLTVERILALMVYGIICFATFFSFIGTVLGGIWADQSWGRFWGWDPKENGALLIVIWTSAYLHARACGMYKERGLMNMAIIGNIVTAWSWFGVNMLGVGLHSYGFMDSGFKWIVLFVASQLFVIALSLIPQNRWVSFRGIANGKAETSGAS